MTRRNAITAGLIAAAVITLLWSAWRIVDARLTLGTSIAAWGLWLILAVAAASAVAYLRELLAHRGSSRRVGWRPVPGVTLLWLAGVSSVAVFGFFMPTGSAARADSSAPVADNAPSTATPSTPATPSSTASPSTSSPTGSAQASKTAPAPGSSPSVVPAAVQTTAVSQPQVGTAPARSAPSSSPTPTSTSSTTSSLVTLPLLPNGKAKHH